MFDLLCAEISVVFSSFSSHLSVNNSHVTDILLNLTLDLGLLTEFCDFYNIHLTCAISIF